jgi:hypothetical protein
MNSFTHLDKEAQRGVAQTLIVSVSKLSEVTNALSTLIPLASTVVLKDELVNITNALIAASGGVKTIYEVVAPDAFKP